jgi:hypothetical protein
MFPKFLKESGRLITRPSVNLKASPLTIKSIPIEAIRGFTFNFVTTNPVTAPQRAPVRKIRGIAIQGVIPNRTISTAATVDERKVTDPIEISIFPDITTSARPDAVMIIGAEECNKLMIFRIVRKLEVLTERNIKTRIIIIGNP